MTEPFADALRRCMSGEDGVMDGAVPRRRKLVQDSDGSDRRKAFGQLYEELGELAFKYVCTLCAHGRSYTRRGQ